MRTSNEKYVESTQKPFLFSILLLLLLISAKSYADHIPFLSGQLTNGLTYYIHHDPHSKHHISLDFIIKTGSLHEQENERGFSHLIEHTILEEIRFKDKKISDPHCEIWNFTCPHIDAVTSYNFTQYHFDLPLTLSKGLEEVICGFANTLSQLTFDEQGVENMKEKVLAEMNNNKFSPIRSWRLRRMAQEYPLYRDKHPLDSQQTISQVSREKINQFYRKEYSSHRIAVIIIGDIDPQLTKRLIENHFGSISNHSEDKTVRPISESFSKGTWVYYNKRLRNTLISLSQPLRKMSQRDILAFSIITQLLSQYLQNSASTPQSAFSQPILETLTYPKMLRLTVSLPDDLEKGVHQLRGVLESFFSQSVTEDQLDQIKTLMKANLEILQTSGNNLFLAEFYRDHFVLNASSLETSHPYLRTTLLDTLRAEDINQMIQSLQEFSHVSLGSARQEVTLISPDLLSKLLLKTGNHSRNSHVN